eukprot:1366_1
MVFIGKDAPTQNTAQGECAGEKECAVECAEGYAPTPATKNNPFKLVCGKTGTKRGKWIHTGLPTCVKICDESPSEKNTNLPVGTKIVKDCAKSSKCKIQCESDSFVPKTSPGVKIGTLTCDAGGKWTNPDAFTCVSKLCAAPEATFITNAGLKEVKFKSDVATACRDATECP